MLLERLYVLCRRVYISILNLIYPPGLYCLCCGKIISADRTYLLCNECMDGFKWAIGRSCLKCGKPLSDSNTRNICFSCTEHAHRYRRAFTCCEYGSHEQTLLYKLKYGSATYIAPVIGEIMHDRLAGIERADDYDLILPAPSHRSRALRRGYNQAELIADELSKRSGIRSRADILVRTTHTKALRSMTPEERRAALRGVFAVNEGKSKLIEGRRILLVDDIYTTGATADAISEVLYEQGAKCVDIMSFASGADVVK